VTTTALGARAARSPARRARELVADYVRLTKPRIISLLLVTTVCAMLVAQEGMPDGWTLLWTTIGGYLAAGGANAINQYVDRDIDARMTRTSGRPVVAGRVSPRSALAFGIALGVMSALLIGGLVNWLAAGLAVLGLLLYVFLYTIWLKRTTTHNIVIGGAAGAVPPLVGWAAATGGLSLEALMMFAIVFFWTPPHFWALALILRPDYEAAGVPMLPNVRGDAETARQIVLWTLVLVGVSLLPAAAGLAGPLYLAAAAALGAAFVISALRLARRPDPARARRTFSYSMLYLALLLGAMVVDAVLL
jgi:protoheme IX farnesyltransferase